jgi:hypothetical protein
MRKDPATRPPPSSRPAKGRQALSTQLTRCLRRSRNLRRVVPHHHLRPSGRRVKDPWARPMPATRSLRHDRNLRSRGPLTGGLRRGLYMSSPSCGMIQAREGPLNHRAEACPFSRSQRTSHRSRGSLERVLVPRGPSNRIPFIPSRSLRAATLCRARISSSPHHVRHRYKSRATRVRASRKMPGLGASTSGRLLLRVQLLPIQGEAVLQNRHSIRKDLPETAIPWFRSRITGEPETRPTPRRGQG